jgi:hypothetical protein
MSRASPKGATPEPADSLGVPRYGERVSFVRGVAIQDARQYVESVGDALAFGSGESLEQDAIGCRPLAADGIGDSFATWGQTHVGLSSVIGPASADDVAVALESREIPACGRRIDSKQQSKRGRRDDDSVCDELQRSSP